MCLSKLNFPHTVLKLQVSPVLGWYQWQNNIRPGFLGILQLLFPTPRDAHPIGSPYMINHYCLFIYHIKMKLASFRPSKTLAAGLGS
jgi:hypothetical protein